MFDKMHVFFSTKLPPLLRLAKKVKDSKSITLVRNLFSYPAVKEYAKSVNKVTFDKVTGMGMVSFKKYVAHILWHIFCNLFFDASVSSHTGPNVCIMFSTTITV